MSIADRSKREVLDRLRLTEGQLGLAEQRIAVLEAKLDLEHEAYMDLFHQLSEYERKELERNAPDCGK